MLDMASMVDYAGVTTETITETVTYNDYGYCPYEIGVGLWI